MTSTPKSRAFLALGGNLGHPLTAFRAACRELEQHPRIDLVATSALYQTPAVGGPAGQPDYLNAVIELRTVLSPHELLAFCRELEEAAGRTRTVRWGARTLDLDLLFFDQQIFASPELTLPHPRLQERRFVLLPLADLAPDLRHPQRNASVTALLAQLPEVDGISRLMKEWLNDD